MANIYSVWHRSWDGTVWSDITSYVQINTVEFTDNIEGEPFSFGFNLHDRLKDSDTQLEVEDGDYIAIINNATGEIAENKKMLGRVDLDANLVGADYVNKTTKPFRFENDIIVKEFDFSDNKLRDFPDENSAAALKGYENTSLTTIIQDILFYSDDFIGKQLSRYSGDDAISSFSLEIGDYDVKSFKVENKSTRQAFLDLMTQERLFFKLRWYYETDVTNGLNVACSIEIFDRAGIAPFHPSWGEADANGQSGVTDELIRVGKVSNSAYASGVTEPKFFYCCKNIDLNTDKDIIRNYILLEAVVVENENAFNDDDNALTRYTEQVDHAKQFNYTLPFPALDIKYVGFLVNSTITNGSVPTTTTFDVPSFDALSFNYDAVSGRGDIVRVYNIATNTQAFREVSNVSGNTVTLSEALPFTPDVNDIVENVQPYWLTIYEDREADNNSFGVVKEIDRDKTDQEAKLRFLDLSEPPPPVELVVYYYKAFKYKDSPFNQASINRYGLRVYEAKLDGIFTKAQIKEIGQKLLILEPNKTLDFVSYRPSEAGQQVPVNITGFLSQTSLVASTVRGRFGGGQLEDNFLYTEYDITLSELKEDIEDIIRRINNQYKSQRSSGNDNDRIIQEETIHVITEINKVKATVTYADWILYEDGGVWYAVKSDGSNLHAMTVPSGARAIRLNDAGDKAVYVIDDGSVFQVHIGTVSVVGSVVTITETAQLTNLTDTSSNAFFTYDSKIHYTNGPLATPYRDAYTMELDGTAKTKIYNVTSPDQYQGANPFHGEAKIIFYAVDGANFGLYEMATDGSGVTQVKGSYSAAHTASISWDDTKILVPAYSPPNKELYTLDIDGSNEDQHTSTYNVVRDPFYKPNSTTEAVFRSSSTNNLYHIDLTTDIVTALTASGTVTNCFWGRIAS